MIVTDPWMPTRESIRQMPLDDLSLGDRLAVRLVTQLGQPHLLEMSGIGNVLPERGPFILAVNHSTKLEALLLPAMLMLLRRGRRVHFFADWNFLMVPGIAWLYGAAQVIVVPNKDARPRFLNALKPLLTSDMPPMEQARRHLAEGRPVGIFPEGTVNHDPVRLMRGRLGAARLSIQSGVPVVAAGLRFPGVPFGAPIPEGSPMQVEFGAAMPPPATAADPDPAVVRDWHAEIMAAIGRLSRKLPPAPKGDDHDRLQFDAQQTS